MKYALRVVLVLASAVACRIAPAQSPTSAQDHLDRALRRADAYNWTEAGPDFAGAERLFLAQGDERNAYYAHLGKIRSTVQHGALAKIIVQLSEDLDSLPFLQTDRRLRMFCLIVKGDFDGESDHAAMARDWEEVHTLAKELGDTRWEHRATAQLGVAAYYNADIEGARQRVGTALIAAHSIRDSPGEMLALAMLANGLNLAKLYGQSLPYSEQAIKLAKKDPEIGFPHVAYQTKLTALIGVGRLDEAQQVADDMLVFARRRQGSSLEAAVLTQSARLARLRKNDQRAIELLSEAVRIASAGGYLDTLADAQSALTDIYLDRKDLLKAETFASQAAKTAQARGDFLGLPARLNTLARLQMEQGKYAEAERVYSRAGAFIDSMIGRSEGVVDKIALIGASSDLYRQHFALIADHTHSPERAYGIVEQVRGRVMADLLAAGSVTAPGVEQVERRAARMRLKLLAARSNAEVRRISDQLFILEQARWVTPDVSILKTQSRTKINIDVVQRGLPPSTAILEYVVGDPRSYCLVITRGNARIVPLQGAAKIEGQSVAYLKSVKAQQPVEEQSRALFEMLLQPISEVEQNENLVVVRDGQLHLLPFDALIDESGKYVAETKVVSYAESASTYCLLRQSRPTPKGGALLGVGAIAYDANTLRRENAKRGYDLNALANLPASKDELMAAAQAVSPTGNTLLLGPAATESAFKHQAFDRYRVLHLAVHGLANTEQPDRAALVMLSDPAADEDGFLQASEVVQLKLNADLAVLSACDTAIGPVDGEEGIVTLSRAFLLAGARTVISTLWSIEDFSSLVLMRQFYAHLAAHMPADQALAEAKRDIIHKFGRKAPPYYWAAFTLEGAGNRISL